MKVETGATSGSIERLAQAFEASLTPAAPLAPVAAMGGVTRAALELPSSITASPPVASHRDEDPAPARYGLVGLSSAGSLTMREGPTDSSRVVGVISTGASDIVDLKTCVRQWCLVWHEGVKGYIQSRFLARIGTGLVPRYRIDGRARIEALKVFDFAGRDAHVVGEIPFYASGIVPIGDCNATWCHIRYLGLVGWVNRPSLVAAIDSKG